MPWKVSKSGDGYKVKNKHSGKTYSKKPMSKEKAKKQMAAIYANTNESFIRRIDEALDGYEDLPDEDQFEELEPDLENSDEFADFRHCPKCGVIWFDCQCPDETDTMGHP